MNRTNPFVIVGLLGSLITTASACVVGGTAGVDPLSLPTAAELATIAEGEVGVTPPPEAAGVRVGMWPLLGPLPTEIADGPPTGNSLDDQLTRRLGDRSGRRPSRVMSCVAHELGVLALAVQRPPTAALREFILHRCGATAVGMTTKTVTWDASKPEPSIDELIESLAIYGSGPVGAWVGANEREGIGVAVLGLEVLQLDPMPMAVQGGHVELTGRVGPHEWIGAAITRGEYGVGECRNLAADAGEFHISCPALESDHGAFIDISVAAPGRWLGHAAARVWVSPDGSMPYEFADPAWNRTPAPIGPDEDLLAVSLQTVNGLREHLGAAPLTLDRAQSDTFDQLRPHYRAAAESGDGKRQDTIAMGLYAGWDLSTRVVDAHFLELRFESILDRRHVLEAVLLSPSARLALLDPDVGLLAMSIEPASVGESQWGYLGTWVPAPVQAHRPDDEEWLFDLVDVARTLRGLPDTYRIGGKVHDILEAAGDEVAAGKRNHESGLNLALNRVVEDQEVPIAGLVYLTQDVRTLEVPKALMRNDVVQMAVHVQQVGVPDTNWARTLVYIAYVYDRDLAANQP